MSYIVIFTTPYEKMRLSGQQSNVNVEKINVEHRS